MRRRRRPACGSHRGDREDWHVRQAPRHTLIEQRFVQRSFGRVRVDDHRVDPVRVWADDLDAPPAQERLDLLADDAGREQCGDAPAAQPPGLPRLDRRARGSAKYECKRRALSVTALDVDRTAEQPAQTGGDRKPESGAAPCLRARRLDLAEALKQTWLQFLADPDASIANANGDGDIAARLLRGADANGDLAGAGILPPV